MGKLGAIIIDNRTLPHGVIERHSNYLPKDWEVVHVSNHNVKNWLDYNVLLTSERFWKAVPFEKVLIFQHDSGLLRQGIEEFLHWDYVGAPWKFQDHGGNGGLSLRTVKTMIETIAHTPYQPIIHGNEDVYFSNNIHRVGGKLAPREVCSKFSCESIFELGTLGYHAIDKHLNNEQVNQIMNQYA